MHSGSVAAVSVGRRLCEAEPMLPVALRKTEHGMREGLRLLGLPTSPLRLGLRPGLQLFFCKYYVSCVIYYILHNIYYTFGLTGILRVCSGSSCSALVVQRSTKGSSLSLGGVRALGWVDGDPGVMLAAPVLKSLGKRVREEETAGKYRET